MLDFGVERHTLSTISAGRDKRTNRDSSPTRTFTASTSYQLQYGFGLSCCIIKFSPIDRDIDSASHSRREPAETMEGVCRIYCELHSLLWFSRPLRITCGNNGPSYGTSGNSGVCYGTSGNGGGCRRLVPLLSNLPYRT